MGIRIPIALVCRLVALALFSHGYKHLGEEHFKVDAAMHLGAVAVELAVAVALVEWLVEKWQRKQSAERLAVSALNRITHHIWVWQGGHRDFSSINELQTILGAVGDADPVPDFTQNLFLVLGSDAANTLRLDREILRENNYLRLTMEDLRPLARMRDALEPLGPTAIAKHLADALGHLREAVKPHELDPRGDVLTLRDPSVEMQKWRHYGDVPERARDKVGTRATGNNHG